MLPEHLYDQLNILQQILDRKPTSKTDFWAIVNKSSPQFERVICEFALNSLHSDTIQLNPKSIEGLTPYRANYITLSNKRSSVTVKRELINRKGHLFILPLLEAILPHILNHVERESNATDSS